MNVYVHSDYDFYILKPFYLFKETNKGVSKVCEDLQDLKSPGMMKGVQYIKGWEFNQYGVGCAVQTRYIIGTVKGAVKWGCMHLKLTDRRLEAHHW